MPGLRRFLRDHRRFAALLVALALAMKALVPAGYMVAGGAKVLTVAICADSVESPHFRKIVVPQEGKAIGEHAKDGQACPFSALTMASTAGADPVLLALVLAFLLTLGFCAAIAPHRRRTSHLRPPLRGPPATV